MLDTNIASEFIKGRYLDSRLFRIPLHFMIVSSITEAEMRYGLAKKPQAGRLRHTVEAFLNSVHVISFDSKAAHEYGRLRSEYEKKGLSVGTLDGLIAAHASSLSVTLITRDSALLCLLPWIHVEKW